MSTTDLFTVLPTIETTRLQIRAATLNDTADFFDFQRDLETWKYFSNIAFSSPEQSRLYIERNLRLLQERQAILLSIVFTEQQKVIGRIRLKNWDQEHQYAEVGYMLHRDFWNKGYMSEALQGLIQYYFTHTALHRLEGQCIVENEGSARVMLKAGMRYEGTQRKKYQIAGIYYDMKMFGITREDL